MTMKQQNYKLILPIALPLIVQGMVFQLQSIVDKSFLGKQNLDYLSAVSVVQFPYFTLFNIIMAISLGLTIVVSQKKSTNNFDEISSVLSAGIKYNNMLSIFIYFIWFFFAKEILLLLNTDASLMPYALDYVSILSVSLLVFGLDVSLNSLLTGLGITKPIMYISIIKVGFNIFLDWILIFGKFGLPAMNIKGAALATTISNIIGLLLLFLYILFFVKEIHLSITSILKAKFEKYLITAKIGIPASLEGLLWNISNLLLISIINDLGKTMAAIYFLTFSLEVISFMFLDGMSKSALTLVGQFYASNNQAKAISILKSCMRYTLILLLIYALIILMYPTQLLSIFMDKSQDGDILLTAVNYLFLATLILFPKSINITVGSGIRATGDTRWMLFTQIFGSTFIVCVSAILIKGFGIGLIGIYITILLDEIIRSIVNTIKFFRPEWFRHIMQYKPAKIDV